MDKKIAQPAIRNTSVHNTNSRNAARVARRHVRPMNAEEAAAFRVLEEGAYRPDKYLFEYDIRRMSKAQATALETLRKGGYAQRFGFGMHILPIAQHGYDAHIEFELELARLEHESAQRERAQRENAQRENAREVSP